VIATPSALHAEQSFRALERGAAVFCQKPLGRTAAEARSVVDAARAADRLLAVDLSYRFTDGMRRIREVVRSGELGRLFAGERGIDVQLSIVKVEGWRREDLASATGLRWIAPSPNLRRFEAALAYPARGLLETTNVSVGRGTPHPFEQLGAPFIDGERLATPLSG